MFEHICSKCGCNFTTKIPWNRDVKEICFGCAMDELEEDE
jgi:hypothetical protein